MYKPWTIEESLKQSLTPRELVEEHCLSAAQMAALHRGDSRKVTLYVDHLEVNGSKPSEAEIRMKVKMRVPLTATNNLGEIVDWMEHRDTLFVKNVVYTERKIADNQTKVIDAMEQRMRKVFGVRYAEINLELPRQADITELDPIVAPAVRKDEKRELDIIKDKWRNYDPSWHDYERSEPAPILRRDEHDLQFMDRQSQARLLAKMGKDNLVERGLYDEVKEIRSKVPKFKSQPPNRGFHPNSRRRNRSQQSESRSRPLEVDGDQISALRREARGNSYDDDNH